MTDGIQHNAVNRSRIIALTAAVLMLGFAHFTIGTARHPMHAEHIILQALYSVPILAAALWFRLRGALIAMLITSAIYYGYFKVMSPNQPIENANQIATLVIYGVAGTVTAALVNVQERTRQKLHRAQLLSRRQALIQSLYGLSDALRLRDEYTRVHSERVSQLAVEIGQHLNLDHDRLEVLRLAGLVHDIGKIGVRDDILLKPQQLSAEERMMIEQHPVMAADILRHIEGAEEIADVVLAHHECPDGSGYPNHLIGNQIPVGSHILRVADVFSSLVDRRPYKAQMDTTQVLRTMDDMGPSKLNSEALAVLHQLVNENNAATI
jgi:putative nucleotidyltransferase with HDIG domain